MKKCIVIFLILISNYVKCQVSFDTLSFNAQVITKLSKPLTAAIDRHIKVAKANKLNKNDVFVLITVYPELSSLQVPKYIIDSIYAINDLKTEFPYDTISSIYSFSIILASKKYYTEGWMGWRERNYYYYNYDNYNVLINSNLDLIFDNANQVIPIKLELIESERMDKVNSYKILTRYSMWNNRYLTEIRYKDLINPHWTGARDEFK